MKSKFTAYLLWFFLGILGAHRFYIGKIGTGILYLCSAGLFGIGWFVDLFTLSGQVDKYNLMCMGKANINNQVQNQSQNVVVNVTAPPVASDNKISPEKIILQLSDKEDNILTIKDILAKTSLEIEDAENALNKLVEKKLAKELVATDGHISYDFS